MRSLIPALILSLGASPATAQQFSAVCSNLSGTRVEDQGSKPRFNPDAVSGASWAYGWDLKTKKATVTFPTKASGGQPNTQKGTVSFHRGGFFTIVSLLPGAGWTHAIYADTGRPKRSKNTPSSTITGAHRETWAYRPSSSGTGAAHTSTSGCSFGSAIPSTAACAKPMRWRSGRG